MHYLLLKHLMLHYINIVLFYVTLLMLGYFNFALFDAALFTVELLNIWHLFTVMKNGVIITISLLLQSTLAIFQRAH